MLVHILNKVWDQRWTDWNIHTVPHTETHISMSLCKGNGAECGTQVDISTCTDACTHSKQGVGTEMRCLGHIHSAIQGHHCFHITMHSGLRWHWKSDRHKYMC